MEKALLQYLYQKVIPIYRHFDQAHQMDHVETVISNALEIATDYEVNRDMVYVIACFHDIGMQFGREDHHITGGQFLFDDPVLPSYFTVSERIIMKEAIEDHRASRKDEPRTLYGKIIAEADRDISPDIVMRRTVQFGIKHYPELDFEAHFERAYQHIDEKYGPHGYLKLWLKTKKNQEGLSQIHEILKNKEKMKELILSLYNNHQHNM
jgi:uncharacterized protein